MHRGQLDVTVETVRALVADQFPAWHRLHVRAVASAGTVNALFRLGDSFVARFPLLSDGIESTRRSLASEARAARELVGRTRFPTPEPVVLGEPGPGYPLPWAVQTWLPGVTAWDEDPSRSVAFGRDLAELVDGVRAIPTRGRTFSGSGRGGHLPDHDAWVQTCLQRSEPLMDVGPLRRLWGRFRELPRSPDADRMTHGDLIPGNVLVADGRLAGVLDVGGLGAADPALDLVGAWHMLEAPARRAFRVALGCDDLEWARGMAWAFQQAMGAVWYYTDSNPAMSAMGRLTLDRIMSDEPAVP